MSSLEQQVARLMALEDIRGVIARYAKAGDDGNDPAQMVRLFSADARWQCAGFGDFQGRETIIEALARVARERVLWSLHYPVAPIIDLDEALRSAHAFWWLWELATLRDASGTEASHWLAGTYDCDFVREPDGWKIGDLVLTIRKMLPYAGGALRETET